VQTLSGLRSAAIDRRSNVYLAPRGEPSDLGKRSLDALSDSRTLTHDELPELFGREWHAGVRAMVAKLLSASSQSSRRKLFCAMKMCEIRFYCGQDHAVSDASTTSGRLGFVGGGRFGAGCVGQDRPRMTSGRRRTTR